jgi:hypothetical protein
MMGARRALLVLLAVAGLAGCEQRKLTEADCALVKSRLETAWNRDAVSAARLAEKDQFLPFIRDEGARMGNRWMTQCEARVGQPVSGAELDCLGRADTIDDVYECGR